MGLAEGGNPLAGLGTGDGLSYPAALTRATRFRTRTEYSVGMSEANAHMTLSPFTGHLNTQEHTEWMEECLRLNRKASGRFARRVAAIGRPFPKRIPPDTRPAPWLYDNEEYEAEG